MRATSGARTQSVPQVTMKARGGLKVSDSFRFIPLQCVGLSVSAMVQVVFNSHVHLRIWIETGIRTRMDLGRDMPVLSCFCVYDWDILGPHEDPTLL